MDGECAPPASCRCDGAARTGSRRARRRPGRLRDPGPPLPAAGVRLRLPVPAGSGRGAGPGPGGVRPPLPQPGPLRRRATVRALVLASRRQRGGHLPAPAAGREDQLPLEQALTDLSEDLRLPVLLHYYVDLPLDQVAAAMGLSLSAVKSRLHRARAVLRRVLVD